ncbi:MAG: GIY-YIG nuclease family protein [Leptolyngbyaceae cyanobacterium RU_5_1]|nr:GIY-YIG nuclease family protein [Leptolyngbyaceae cyanobacterium RU_5_1]
MAVYLLHFDRLISPNHTTQHYLGFAENLENRISQHRNGSGSRLCAVAKERGIGFVLARTWEGDRQTERQLKRQKGSPRLCPICRCK